MDYGIALARHSPGRYDHPFPLTLSDRALSGVALLSRLLEGLNPAQQQAVTATEGPVLVLAGPGSGKTRVLTHRAAYLIQERGIRPWQIMAVTFTNKAANEMKERLAVLLGGTDLQRMTIGTFHAICVRILRREADTIGLDSNFVIYDDSDQQSLVKQAIKDLALDDKLYRPRAMLSIISRAKTNLLRPGDFSPRTYREEIAGRVYARYQDALQANNALDFDDLLARVVFAFREHPALLEKYQQRYRYILVDEFQDTNAVQYELVQQLAGAHHNLFVVGDEDQSIYAFRGANFYNVLRFEQDYPDTTKILLEQNYRSTQTILDAANAVITPNTQRTAKKLFTERAKGASIIVHEAYDENEEGRWVVATIQALAEQGIASGECAVMYRINAQSRALEDAFVAEGMPYKLVGATRFYARREIKDLIADLRIIHNPYDTVSLMRVINVPPRRIGGKTQNDLGSWATANGLTLYEALEWIAEGITPGSQSLTLSTVGRKALLPFYELWKDWIAARDQITVRELLDKVLEESRYAPYIRDGSDEGQERWENVLELRAVAAEYDHLPVEEALTLFLEEVSLVSDVDNLDETDAPTLLTLHSAKGLEFRVVFIVGLNDGMLPHSRSFDDPDGLEEERRLLYVGVTRAEDRLHLSHTFRRTIFGSSDLGDPSRFLADIPSRLKEKATRSRSPLRSPASSWSVQSEMSLGRPRPSAPVRERLRAVSQRKATTQAPFNVGDQVKHPAFGEGTVIQVEPRGDDWDLTVAFKGRGIKTLALSFANLHRSSR
jgi:DNA helicase-2/ATP-dependent DNA helicase PcrA